MEFQLTFVTEPTGAKGDMPRLPNRLGSKAQRCGENAVRIIGKEPMT
jgi:hypothetical protein